MFKALVLIAYLATPLSESTAIPVEPEQSAFLFYNPDGIGAHAFHTPWAIVIESGLEEYNFRPLDQLDLLRGQKRVIEGLLNPVATIKHYGAKNFVYQQLLPLSSVTGAPPSYIPNYLWHTIGGGFRHRMMTEYFTHQGSEYPQLWSWLTLYAGHWINEAVQAQKFSYGSADALADLLVFDWVGKVLFLNDDVAEFFAHTLHLRDWTYQTSWNPITNSLHNTGQLFWARLDLWQGFSISTLTGHLINAANLTYSPNENLSQWTLGAGLQATRFKLLANDDLAPGQMRWCFLAAYSENDNPLVVIVAKQGLPNNTRFDTTAIDPETLTEYNFVLAGSVQVNIYPKWFEVWGEKIAIHVSWMEEAFFVGIGHHALPVGMSLSTPLAEKYRDDFY